MASNRTQNINIAFLAIFALSVTIKSAVFIFATDPVIFAKYPYFARELAAGRDIGERLLDLSPLYLSMVTLFFKAFGPNWDLLAMLQIIIGSLTCVLTGVIGTKLFNPVIGIISSILLVLYGNMTLIELTFEPEVLLVFLNALAVLTLLWAEKNSRKSSKRWFPAGLTIGLAAITKANVLLLLPGAVIWAWISSRDAPWKASAWLLLGAALVISPITIRNFILFDDFVLLTADGGKVFFHGNGPGADGMERADLPDQGFIEEGRQEPDYAHTLFRMTARGETKTNLKPSACSSYWVSRTIDHILADPRAALDNIFRKLLLFFNDYEVHDLDTTYKSYKIIEKWPLITAGMLTALGFSGMILSAGMFRQLFLSYWTIFTYFFSVIIFFSATRYRLPAFGFLSIFAAYFLYDLYSSLRERKFKKSGASLILLAFFIALAHMPLQAKIKRFDKWQQISRIDYSLEGRMLFKKGLYSKAARSFEKVVAAAPDFTPAVNYLGKTYAILGENKKAAACFQEVMILSPKLDEGYLNTGLLLELTGNKKEAAGFFEKALALNPQNAKALSHLTALTDH